MKQYIEQMLNMPYWAVSLLVSVLFAEAVLVVFTLTDNLDSAIKAASVLGLLSLFGFGCAKLVMPDKPQGNRSRKPSIEAKIIVEGVKLTEAQSMTFLVALNSFIVDLLASGIGDDDVGKRIAAGYVENSEAVLSLIHQKS